jgi:hypothetical protein
LQVWAYHNATAERWFIFGLTQAIMARQKEKGRFRAPLLDLTFPAGNRLPASRGCFAARIAQHYAISSA